jgi:hypothetical protein
MISWLTGKVALYVSGALLALVVALSVAYWIQSIALSASENEVRRVGLEVTRLEAEKKRLLDAVKDQNEAIEKLKTIAIEKGRAADEALAEARKSAAKYEASRKRLAALLAVPAPSGAGAAEGVAAVRKELGK